MPIRHPLPVVSQLRTVDPDGLTDPAAYTDCGESCVASLLIAADRVRLSPGCIRQSLGLPELVGTSTAEELAGWLERIGLSITVEGPASRLTLQQIVESAARSDGACIILGDWNAPNLSHWNLSGRVFPEGCWCMDPAQGRNVKRTWVDLERAYLGSTVVAHAR